jgi:hypothetical protein
MPTGAGCVESKPIVAAGVPIDEPGAGEQSAGEGGADERGASARDACVDGQPSLILAC